jgi:peptidoglycan hydrolase-like protein with peptidoglycan-binding domain
MRIVTREEWGARTPRYRNAMRSFSRDFIHHSAGPIGQTPRNIQDFHMDGRGWSDIAYSFLVDQKGTIYEGRGWGISGGHTRDYNSISHAFCLIANTQTVAPSDAAIKSLAFLVDESERRYKEQLVQGHRDVAATACPGNKLYAILDDVISSTGAPPMPTLRRGSKGEDVTTLQSILNLAVSKKIVVDGDYGPATEFAVREYQTILKVKVDGVWGPEAHAAHNALFAFLESLDKSETPVSKPAEPASKDRPLLKMGDAGPEVENLQKQLVKLGSEISVSSVFDLPTQKAVKGFQSFFKVEGGADGIVGSNTWDLIDFLTAKKEQDDARQAAEDANRAAEQARLAAIQEQKDAEAKRTEQERKDSLAEAAQAKRNAAELEARAAELEAEAEALEDLLERDRTDVIQAELDRVSAEKAEVEQDLESAVKEVGILRKIINTLVNLVNVLLNSEKNIKD